MLFTEYNLADALEVAREEGREDVWEEARAALADARAEIRRAETQRQAAEAERRRAQAERQAEQLQFARYLKKEGWDTAKIAEATKLDPETIASLFG
jgi:hypothetical protein